MKLWLLIPVKGLGQGKSRLAEELSPQQRIRLSLALLQRLLQVAAEAAVCVGILVISRDREILREANALGALTLAESGHGLNQALEQGAQETVRLGADALLVLPADLPQVEAADIRQLARLATRQPGLVIAPSVDGGTNALLQRPPGLIDFAFGVDSFHRHCELARTAGVAVTVVDSPTLAVDLDRPADLVALPGGADLLRHNGEEADA